MISPLNATGIVVGGIISATVAWHAFDFAPCSTYEAGIVREEVASGGRLYLRFQGTRHVEGCRVFASYHVFDGAGIEIFSWDRDIQSPGPVGPFTWVVPLPLQVPATPGQGRVTLAVSEIKNPVQQGLYTLTGWTTTHTPHEFKFTILPPEGEQTSE